jgi:hypothetical protein
VPAHTREKVNRRIRGKTEDRIFYYAAKKKEIGVRLGELDREWDVERAIEANASTLALGGIILGTTHDMRWLMLPAAVATFLLQHAIQGWCPPVPVLRRLGFRTADEINQERYALKAIRGDFSEVSRGGGDKAHMAMEATGLRSSKRSGRKRRR